MPAVLAGDWRLLLHFVPTCCVRELQQHVAAGKGVQNHAR
jgi:hypothetical protein